MASSRQDLFIDMTVDRFIIINNQILLWLPALIRSYLQA